MSNVIIILSVFFFSIVTFFSGFGLATVLTPILILFFPAPIAISLTAVIHLINNLFKLFLTGKHANKEVLFKFGIPAMLGAIFGSFALLIIAKKSFIINYHLFNNNFHVEFINFIIGILIFFFAIFELLPKISDISLNKNLLPFGGLMSGFFGGLSGHQGAFRSVFLIKCNLSKEQFIATGVLIACLVDIIRLFIYGTSFLNEEIKKESLLLAFTAISGFLGSSLANKYMQQITINLIQRTIILMLLFISIGLVTGLI